MFILKNFLFTLLPFININEANNKNILPPINNIYKTSLNIPLLGSQNIEYKRIGLLESQVKLDGRLNAIGYINFNENNIYEYSFDETLQKIVKKYKCTIYNPYYDNINDIINFKIKINIIQFQKTLILKNIDSLD